MSKRYFYTDPLKVAWMAKQFGMRYSACPIDGTFDSLSTNYLCNGSEWIFPERFYIHPDSLHLLEPVRGDLVTNLGMAAWRVIGICADTLLIVDDRVARKNEVTIIQRNGIPFMWPESEAA